MWELYAVIALIKIVYFLCNSVIIVPTRRFVVLERFGSFSRVLLPGLHWVVPFVDKPKQVHWTYVGQDGTIVHHETYHIAYDKVQMDICPIKCLTKDQIQLTIDGTLMYHISKADAAVYETDDVLNVFYQTAQQATRTTISALLASEMQSKETIISTLVTDAINKTLGGKGIVCDAFIIQQIGVDPAILNANQAIYVKSRQAQMAMEEQHAEHAKQRAALEQRTELLKLEQQLKETAQVFDNRMRALDAEAVADKERIRLTVLQQAGYSVEQQGGTGARSCHGSHCNEQKQGCVCTFVVFCKRPSVASKINIERRKGSDGQVTLMGGHGFSSISLGRSALPHACFERRRGRAKA